MAASAMSTTLSTIKLPSVSKMWKLMIKINRQLLEKKGKSLQYFSITYIIFAKHFNYDALC